MDRFSLSFFLATVCLLLRPGATTETLVTCGAHVHRLECDSGVISVDTALYGRADQTTCASDQTILNITNTTCSHDDALDVLKKRCNGKRWCELNSGVFKVDPCTGTFKYLKTTYSCVPAIHRIVCEHSIAHLQCPEGKVIRVLGEDFGRSDSVTCSFRRQSGLLTNTDCSNPTNALGQKCNGRASCDLRASFLVLDEYCVDTSPYLEYSYVCDDAQ